MGYVPYDPSKHEPESVELALVNPKCNYVPGSVTIEDGSTIDNVNGGQIIAFSIDSASDPTVLETELRTAIQRTQEEHGTYIPSCTRSITSLYDSEINGHEGIRLERSVYTDEIIQEITESLERELVITLKFKGSRGRQPKDYVKYSSISW